MRIPDKGLDEFIEIYKEEFGEELSRTKASEMASDLIALYQRLARRLPDVVASPSTSMQLPDDHPPLGFRT